MLSLHILATISVGVGHNNIGQAKANTTKVTLYFVYVEVSTSASSESDVFAG